MALYKNLAGLVFGRLTAGEYIKPSKWSCVCECGTEKVVSSHNLLNGTARSCGCLKLDALIARRTSHGMTNSSTYVAWCNMKARCYYVKLSGYHNYGGRGIEVCDRWLNSFENFLEDMGERPSGLSLDRINTDLNYTKENCRWTDWSTQMNNQRRTIQITHNGRTMSRSQWAREIGIDPNLIKKRMASGMSVDQALTAR